MSRFPNSQPMIRRGLLALLVLLLPGGVLAGDPPSPRARCRSLLAEAHAALAAGQPDSALSSLTAVLEIDPTDPDAHYLIGGIQLAAADTAAAITTLTEGMKLAPLSSRLKLLTARIDLAQGRLAAADSLALTVLALKPRQADALFVRGMAALARQDSTAALAHWQLALVAELGEAKR